MTHIFLRPFILIFCLLVVLTLAESPFNRHGAAAGRTCSPIALATTSLPVATANRSYNINLESTGGVAPYNFVIQSGTLPNGLSFNNGAFGGTPTQTGVFTFLIQTTDANNCGGSQEFTLRVQSPPIMIPSASLELTQGSSEQTITLATVNDVETDAGHLSVTANIVPGDLVLSNLLNTDGAITASVAANCSASIGAKTILMSVSDGDATTQVNITITIKTNPGPTLGTYTNSTVSVFGNATITPTATPADNGTIKNLTVAAPNFSGSLTIDAAGVISISNAGPVGNYTVTVVATDNCNLSSQQSFNLTVIKATPVITWNNPADIIYGTALSATQLNATSNVPGTFIYAPLSGSVLNAGNAQNLSVNFAPNDTANYNNASKNVSINVLKAALTVVANNVSRNFGDPNPTLTGSITGLKNNDPITATFSTTALQNSPIGQYPITITLNDPNNRLSNYNVTTNNGIFTIKPVLDDGVYTMIATSSNKCIQPSSPFATAGIRLNQNACSGGNEQKWQVQHLGDNIYRLTNVATGLVAEVAGGLLSDFAPVDQGIWTNAAYQKWRLRKVGNAFELVSINSNLLLEVLGIPIAPGVDNSTVNGVQLDQHISTSTSNQKFIFQ